MLACGPHTSAARASASLNEHRLAQPRSPGGVGAGARRRGAGGKAKPAPAARHRCVFARTHRPAPRALNRPTMLFAAGRRRQAHRRAGRVPLRAGWVGGAGGCIYAAHVVASARAHHRHVCAHRRTPRRRLSHHRHPVGARDGGTLRRSPHASTAPRRRTQPRTLSPPPHHCRCADYRRRGLPCAGAATALRCAGYQLGRVCQPTIVRHGRAGGAA